MGKVVLINNLTLDGVMQAPGRPDEDTRGGFEHGGARMPNEDPDIGRAMAGRMARSGPLLAGRRTYEHFSGFWPHQQDNPLTEVLVVIATHQAASRRRRRVPWAEAELVSARSRRRRAR